MTKRFKASRYGRRARRLWSLLSLGQLFSQFQFRGFADDFFTRATQVLERGMTPFSVSPEGSGQGIFCYNTSSPC